MADRNKGAGYRVDLRRDDPQKKELLMRAATVYVKASMDNFTKNEMASVIEMVNALEADGSQEHFVNFTAEIAADFEATCPPTHRIGTFTGRDYRIAILVAGWAMFASISGKELTLDGRALDVLDGVVAEVNQPQKERPS